MWAAVHDAVTDGDGRGMGAAVQGFDDGGEGFGLRFEDVFAVEGIAAERVADVERSGIAADVVGSASEEELFGGIAVWAGSEEAELERGGAAVEYEDRVVGGGHLASEIQGSFDFAATPLRSG